MNAIFLVYLWGIYDNIMGTLIAINIVLVILTGIIIFVYIIVYDESEYIKERSVIWIRGNVNKFIIWAIVLTTVNMLTPSKNIVVMMFSANPIINTVKDISDSNTTKRLGNVLDNTLKYLEKKSKELD